MLNNGFQVTIWAMLVLTASQKPSKRLMALAFAPFLPLSIFMMTSSQAQNQELDALTEDSLYASTALWFGLFAFSYCIHKEPSASEMV